MSDDLGLDPTWKDRLEVRCFICAKRYPQREPRLLGFLARCTSPSTMLVMGEAPIGAEYDEMMSAYFYRPVVGEWAVFPITRTDARDDGNRVRQVSRLRGGPAPIRTVVECRDCHRHVVLTPAELLQREPYRNAIYV